MSPSARSEWVGGPVTLSRTTAEPCHAGVCGVLICAEDPPKDLCLESRFICAAFVLHQQDPAGLNVSPRTMNATVWRGSADEWVRLQKEELFCQWLEALQVLNQKVKKKKPTERDPFLSRHERARCRPHLRTPLHPLRSASLFAHQSL